MKFLDRGSILNINGTNMTVSEVISILKKVPSYEIVELFGKNNKLLPRTARMKVLKNLLNDDVQKTRIRGVNLSDEINYRLNWYNNFSEYQLCELIPLFSSWDEKLEEYYLEDIWLMLLQVANEMGVTDEELTNLILKASNAPVVPLETSRDFNKGIDPLFYDYSGCLDGITIGTFRDCLINSSTLVELREIGKKYNVNVPRRIKKEQLVEIILDNMDKQDVLDREKVKESLMDKSVIQLQRFAKDNNIKASVELKKEDIIEYIISNLEFDTTKLEKVIQLPVINITPRFLLVDASKKYMVEAEEETATEETYEEVLEPTIEEEKVEEVAEEVLEPTIEEEKVEEVVEKVVEPVTEQKIDNTDIKSLTEAINGLKDEIAKLFASIEVVEEEQEPETKQDDNQDVVEELVKIQGQVEEVKEKLNKKEEEVKGINELNPTIVESFKNDTSKSLSNDEMNTYVEETVKQSPSDEYCKRELKFQQEFNKVYAKHPVKSFFKAILWLVYYLILIAIVLGVVFVAYYLVVAFTNLEAPTNEFLRKIFDFVDQYLNLTSK